MSSDTHASSTSERGLPEAIPDDRYDALSHPRRIRLLDILEEHTQLSLTALTTELLERTEAKPTDGQTRHAVRTSLVHNHLPRLAEDGLVEWDEADSIELVAEPPDCLSDLTAILDSHENESAIITHLTDPVRLDVLGVLETTDCTLSLEELASMIADNGANTPSDPEQMKIRLHHAHLPALDDSGVIEYERESGEIEQPDDEFLF
ncbi:ArsR family transcriptional regulator [Natrialbaceae archaeon A-arb3/5]